MIAPDDEHGVPVDDDEQSLHRKIVCGLSNLGNTCYFNSGLQLLAGAESFVSALRHVNPFDDSVLARRQAYLAPSHSTERQKLFQLTARTFEEMYSGESATISPQHLLRQFAEVCPMFQGLHQQDCPEMITHLLGNLEDAAKLDMNSSQVLREIQQCVAASPHEPSQVTSSSSATALDESHPADAARLHQSTTKYLSLLKLMQNVNSENAEDEKEEKHKKGMTTYQVSDFRAPTLTRSAVTDPFRGYMLHEITCHACKHVSRTIDEFTSLAVEIPTGKQRAAHAQRAGHIPRYDAHGALLNEGSDTKRQGEGKGKMKWWNPLRCIISIWSVLYSWCCCCCGCDDGDVDYPLTLEECLDIHFDEEVLSGQNRYHCGRCKKATDATKRHSIIWHPETLLIHLKRFQVGAYWTSKTTDAVVFPLGNSGDGLKPWRALELAETFPSRQRFIKYDLLGVVNHHGSFGGGHYTAYSYKGPQLGWILCNDDRANRVSAQEVADSQEYVLLYNKRLDEGQESPAAAKARDIAKSLLRTSSSPTETTDGTGKRLYVSKAWLHRAATFVEPGPLLNKMCYCSSSCVTAHSHGSARAFYTPACKDQLLGMVEAFGGDLSALAIDEKAMRDIEAEEDVTIRKKQQA